jgi:hypothetical protein
MISEERANHVMVSADHQPDELGHNRCRRFSQCRRRDWRRVALSASHAGGLHITTTSTAPISPGSRLKVSRIRRFIRLRSTALDAHLREMARPSRGSVHRSERRRASNVKKRSALFAGCSNTRRKSFGRSRRLRRGNCSLAPRAGAASAAGAFARVLRTSDGAGPWHDAP